MNKKPISDEQDQMVHQAAAECSVSETQGKKIARRAAAEAALQMTKMIPNLKSPEAKIEALRHHSLHMGIGIEFIKTIAPKGESMEQELLDIGVSKNEAGVLSEIWMAKVFIQLGKELDKLQSDDE